MTETLYISINWDNIAFRHLPEIEEHTIKEVLGKLENYSYLNELVNRGAGDDNQAIQLINMIIYEEKEKGVHISIPSAMVYACYDTVNYLPQVDNETLSRLYHELAAGKDAFHRKVSTIMREQNPVLLEYIGKVSQQYGVKPYVSAENAVMMYRMLDIQNTKRFDSMKNGPMEDMS